MIRAETPVAPSSDDPAADDLSGDDGAIHNTAASRNGVRGRLINLPYGLASVATLVSNIMHQICAEYAPIMREYAPKGLLRAYCCIAEEFCVSHLCVSVFSDFQTLAGAGTVLANHASEATQVSARVVEAPRQHRSRRHCGRLKICAFAHIRDR
jgi:hypothetical protein